MDFAFSSQRELYERVLPALRAKKVEFNRLDYSYIKEIDVWNYLIERKWRKGKDLSLSDIVNDILNVDCHEVNQYLKGRVVKEERTQNFSGKEMI